MTRARLVLSSFIFLSMVITMAFINAMPRLAIALVEGRTYDQAHDTGYLDWSGSVQYVQLYHRDNTALPPEEGGTLCASGCTEWVTRIGNGGTVSGSFDRNVTYFEVMVAISHDASVGDATLRACGAANTYKLYQSSGSGAPGFISMPLSVPAGCSSWMLSASSGYVDFRSTDVFYGAPLPTSTYTATPLPSQTATITNTATLIPTSTSTLTFTPTYTVTASLTPSFTATSTATFTPTYTSTSTLTFTPTYTITPSLTPSFTPTNTATFTPTYTATSTATNTPTFTPTPLPPQIAAQIRCDLWGNSGWCRGNEFLDLIASDPQGFAVTIGGNVNGVQFACGSSCAVPLPEGTGNVNYVATSSSGRTVNGVSIWQRDGTPPLLNLRIPAPGGLNGWYRSGIDVAADASDAISGLLSIAGSTDAGGSWTTFPFHIQDGINYVAAHARDVAGNEAMVNQVVRIDTILPVSQFTSHSNGAVVQGNITLGGKFTDQGSGVSRGEISFDEGVTWHSASLDTQGAWSFTWNSNEIINGQYTILLRSTDNAGNTGETTSLTLVVDNQSPRVSLTDRWWIWEWGELKVSPNYFPIASVHVTISDPEDRWPAVMMKFDPDKIPSSISWNRRFADGTLATAGEYTVGARACDTRGLCGSDTGVIVIPLAATATPTSSPCPTPTSQVIASATTTAWVHPVPSTPVLNAVSTQTPEISPQSATSFPLWPVLALIGLFIAISSASVVDPRPAALHRIGETLQQISQRNKSNSNKNIFTKKD